MADPRRYGYGVGGLEAVSPGVFTDSQRRRLEAFTAAVGLLKTHDVDDLLRVARYIDAGAVAPVPRTPA